MGEISSRMFGDIPGRCPKCQKVSLDVSLVGATLSEIICSACGSLSWALRVDASVFVFDKGQLNGEEWNDVQFNIPHETDTATLRVEKIMFLESLSSSSFVVEQE